MNTSNPDIADEMLSAYLDDELNPDAKARVIAALESDARLRTLVADLQQIRTDIQALPAHSLSTGFAERIVESCASHDGDTVTRKPGKPSSSHRLRWIVGLAATAAMIMIAFWAVGSGGVVDSTGTPKVAQTDTEFAPSDSSNAATNLAEIRTDAADQTRAETPLVSQPASVAKAPAPNAGSPVAASAAAPQLRSEVKAFDWASQKESADAVVTVTLPEDRIAQLGRTGWHEDSRRFAGPEPDEELGEQEPSTVEFYFYAQAQRPDGNAREFGIESDTRLIVIEGTSQQITDIMRSLEATATNTLSLKVKDVGISLGLPPVGSSAPNAMADLDDRFNRESVPGVSLREHLLTESALRASDDALAGLAAAPAPTARSARIRPPVELMRQPADQPEDRQESTRKYRILMIVGQR